MYRQYYVSLYYTVCWQNSSLTLIHSYSTVYCSEAEEGGEHVPVETLPEPPSLSFAREPPGNQTPHLEGTTTDIRQKTRQ